MVLHWLAVRYTLVWMEFCFLWTEVLILVCFFVWQMIISVSALVSGFVDWKRNVRREKQNAQSILLSFVLLFRTRINKSRQGPCLASPQHRHQHQHHSPRPALVLILRSSLKTAQVKSLATSPPSSHRPRHRSTTTRTVA
jgi:hypothetical protein